MAEINLGRVKGDDGVGLQYKWDGTKLGVKRETDSEYVYVDLASDLTGEQLEQIAVDVYNKVIKDVNSKLDTKANKYHTHNIDDVNGLDNTLKELENKIGTGTVTSVNDVRPDSQGNVRIEMQNIPKLTASLNNNTVDIIKLRDNIGKLDDLETLDKSNLVAAINEASKSGGTGGTGGAVDSVNGKTGHVKLTSGDISHSDTTINGEFGNIWTAVNGKAFTDHTHMPKDVYLNYQGDTLDEISAKHIDYDGWDNVDDKIKELERKISNIDSPDLGHITSEIEYLKQSKADSLYVVGEIIKLEKMISDITTGGGNSNYVIPRETKSPLQSEVFYQGSSSTVPYVNWSGAGNWDYSDRFTLKLDDNSYYHLLEGEVTSGEGTLELKFNKDRRTDPHRIFHYRGDKTLLETSNIRDNTTHKLNIKKGDKVSIYASFVGKVNVNYIGDESDLRLSVYKNNKTEKIAIKSKVEELLEDYTLHDEFYSKTGQLENLKTDSKDNLVNAINEAVSGSSGVTLISGGNVNNLMETGMYFLSDMYGDSGLPQGVYFAYMIVIVGKQSEELMQIIFDSDKESDTYIRFYFDHSWRKWTKLVNISDLEGLGGGSSSSKVKPRITDSPDTNELYLKTSTRAEFELEVLRISDDVKQDDLRFTFTSEEDSYSEVTLKITSGKGRFHFTTTQTDGYYTYELRKPDGEKESSGWVSGNKSVTLNVKEGDEFRLNTSKSLILTVSKPDEVETTELYLNGAPVSSGEGGSVDLSEVFAQIKKLDEDKANTLHDHSYGDIPGLRFDLKNLQSQIDELGTSGGNVDLTEINEKIDNLQSQINGLNTSGDVVANMGVTLPTPSSVHRGKIYTLMGYEDVPYICLKQGDNYVWERLLGGFK